MFKKNFNLILGTNGLIRNIYHQYSKNVKTIIYDKQVFMAQKCHIYKRSQIYVILFMPYSSAL